MSNYKMELSRGVGNSNFKDQQTQNLTNPIIKTHKIEPLSPNLKQPPLKKYDWLGSNPTVNEK
jgi:hypothetical protein